MNFLICVKNALTANGAVLRQAGCISADSLVGIWKRIARMNISEPPPERKAAGALCASRESVVEKVVHLERTVQPDKRRKRGENEVQTDPSRRCGN
jgi:anaerobic selenocysteine-containing dehydrogenase